MRGCLALVLPEERGAGEGWVLSPLLSWAAAHISVAGICSYFSTKLHFCKGKRSYFPQNTHQRGCPRWISSMQTGAEGSSVQILRVHLGLSTRTFRCYQPLSGGDAALGLAARLLCLSSASSPPDTDSQGDVVVTSGAGGSFCLKLNKQTNKGPQKPAGEPKGKGSFFSALPKLMFHFPSFLGCFFALEIIYSSSHHSCCFHLISLPFSHLFLPIG